MNEPASQYIPKPSAVSTGDLIDSKKYQENIERVVELDKLIEDQINHSYHYYDYDRNGGEKSITIGINDIKTLPYQEHNSLLATREFLLTLIDEKKITDLPEKIILSAKSLLKYYPSKLRLDELYKENTIMEISSNFCNENDKNSNKIDNNNQTWNTPGFKWKTQVEFISNSCESSL